MIKNSLVSMDKNSLEQNSKEMTFSYGLEGILLSFKFKFLLNISI